MRAAVAGGTCAVVPAAAGIAVDTAAVVGNVAGATYMADAADQLTIIVNLSQDSVPWLDLRVRAACLGERPRLWLSADSIQWQ